MHRKRSRSSSGVAGLLRQREHAAIERELRQLAIDRRRTWWFHRLGSTPAADAAEWQTGQFVAPGMTVMLQRVAAGAFATATWDRFLLTLNASPSNSRPPRMRERRPDPLLAVVDLGSNSFRLEIGRVEGDQIYQLDTWRETLRFGAGLDDKGRLKRSAMDAALACLARFRERLSGLQPVGGARRRDEYVPRRAATPANSWRSPSARWACRSTSSAATKRRRLTFFGVAHELPRLADPRLVIDIGGGSTGVHHRPRARARTARVARDRLRRHDAALLPRRRDHRGGAGRGRNRGARRNRSHRRRVRPATTGARPTARPARRWRSPIFWSRTLSRVAASRRRDSPASPAHARRRSHLAPQAQGAQRRAGAGARRRARHHGGGGRRSSGSSASTRSAARCGSACSTTSSDARSTRTRAR